MTVYVIQNSRQDPDISPASAYGDITFLLGLSDRTSLNPERTMKLLFERLKHFREDKDHILWSGGDPLSLMLVGTVLSEMGLNFFSYLRYEKPRRNDKSARPYYVPVRVTISEE